MWPASLLLDSTENCHLKKNKQKPGFLHRAVVLKNRCEMTATRQQEKKGKKREETARGNKAGRENKGRSASRLV